MKKVKIKTLNGSDFTLIEGPNKKTFVSKDGTSFNEPVAKKLLKRFPKELVEVKEEELKEDKIGTIDFVFEDEGKPEDIEEYPEDIEEENSKEDEILIEVPKKKKNRKSKKKSKKNK